MKLLHLFNEFVLLLETINWNFEYFFENWSFFEIVVNTFFIIYILSVDLNLWGYIISFKKIPKAS